MPVTDYTPTTSDVAKILRARTRDSMGNMVGDFNDKTTPNSEQASASIADAADEVAEALGADLPADAQAPAKRLVILLAAANIEMSFFPEQAAQNNSMYDKLMARVKTLMTSLQSDVAEEAIDTDESVGYDFPPTMGWGGLSW